MTSAIRSTRWARAVSVLTTKISRFAGLTCLVNQQPTQTRLHFFVNTSVAILRLCDFSARPRRVCADTRDRIEQDLTWQSRSVLDTLGRGRIFARNVTTSIYSEPPASVHICSANVDRVVLLRRIQATIQLHFRPKGPSVPIAWPGGPGPRTEKYFEAQRAGHSGRTGHELPTRWA